MYLPSRFGKITFSLKGPQNDTTCIFVIILIASLIFQLHTCSKILLQHTLSMTNFCYDVRFPSSIQYFLHYFSIISLTSASKEETIHVDALSIDSSQYFRLGIYGPCSRSEASLPSTRTWTSHARRKRQTNNSRWQQFMQPPHSHKNPKIKVRLPFVSVTCGCDRKFSVLLKGRTVW